MTRLSSPRTLLIAGAIVLMGAAVAVPTVLGASGSAEYAPVNDHAQHAEDITLSDLPIADEIDATHATSQPTEPDHQGPAVASAWWRWTAIDDGSFVASTSGSGVDTVLAAYKGLNLSAVTAVGSATGPSGTGASISFAATSGEVFWFAIDQHAATGLVQFNLAWDHGAEPNDSFASASTISTTAVANNASATAESGEPAHGGETASRSLWWTWTPTSTGPATIDTCGSEYDTTLAVYTGGAVNSLTLVAQNDEPTVALTCDPTHRGLSVVGFTAVAGTTYMIAVDGFVGASGPVALNVTHSGGPVLCDGEVVTHDLTLGASGTGTNGPDVFLGTSGPDVINGRGGDDIICGEDGDDQIDAGNGNDRVFGGGGADTIYGRSGDDWISAGDGDDWVGGSNGDDTISGGAGQDELNGGGNNDTIYGNDDDDIINGDLGNDLLFGSLGDDELNGSDGIDRLFGQGGNDDLFGDLGDDRLYGGGGADLIEGGDGIDRLYGQAGNDTVHGQAGADRIYGGVGVDTLTGGDDNDTMYGQSGDDAIAGGNGDDIIYGNVDDDTLAGDAGVDRLYGQGGDDVLDGGDDDDLLYGGGNDDDLDGADGDDSLYGQGGNDDLIGGPGGTDLCHGGTGGGDTADGTCETQQAVP